MVRKVRSLYGGSKWHGRVNLQRTKVSRCEGPQNDGQLLIETVFPHVQRLANSMGAQHQHSAMATHLVVERFQMQLPVGGNVFVPLRFPGSRNIGTTIAGVRRRLEIHSGDESAIHFNHYCFWEITANLRLKSHKSELSATSTKLSLK